MQIHKKSFFHRKVHIFTVILALLLLSAAIYLMVAWYYRDGFSFNTWINGIYCTGRTVEEVNSELLSQTEAPIVTISDGRGGEWQLALQDISCRRDYKEKLQAYLKQQNPWLWGIRLFHMSSGRQMTPDVSYDEEALLMFWNSLPFVQSEDAPDLWIEWTQYGYQLQDKRAERINQEKAYALLQETIAQGGTSLNLKEAGIYEEPVLTEEQLNILQQWEKINDFQALSLIYDMGEEKLILDALTLGGFLIRKEDGSFLEEANGQLAVSREKVDAFIKELTDTYDTYGREREFLSTRGDLVTVPAGTYGTLLDGDAEREYLMNALENRISEIHIPSYKKEPYHRGKDDIGDTYIEVDMTQQKMYYYQDGECLVETDIVTGNTGRRMGTPQGVNYVYAKQKNRVLRGPGYASFVNFWMPVKGNIGIHDAGWRAVFGGEIYKTSGSHGCINTPYEKMKLIYEEAEIGTPVIMFY